MKTDLPLKRLFQLRPQDLLQLTGDEGASVFSVKTLELPEIRRTVDCVLELERGGERYLRHVEFQGRDEPYLPRRCFEYNTRLHLQSGLPVLTTVLLVNPPAPKREPVYRIQLGDQVSTDYRFEWVKLWELDSEEAVALGNPAMLALVPLMAGNDLDLVEKACLGIEASAPEQQQPDLLAILHVFAEQRYTGRDLSRLIGRERIMQSTIWQEAKAEGREEGREQGREEMQTEWLEHNRALCLKMVKRHHPTLLEKATPAIKACTDQACLENWILQASRLTTDEFRRSLGPSAH